MNYDKLQAATAINNNSNNNNNWGNKGSTMASRGYRGGKGIEVRVGEATRKPAKGAKNCTKINKEKNARRE